MRNYDGFEKLVGCGMIAMVVVWVAGLIGAGWLLVTLIDFLSRH